MAGPGIITLTTDFGYQDPFAGTMKGVLLGLNSNLQIVDICHGVPPQRVFAGALVLSGSVPFFPRGTIHVGVVDPGVGSERRALLIEAAGSFFIGPDNGLFTFALKGLEVQRIIDLTNDSYHLKPTSTTFHGRDIFAPVAAYLSLGVPPQKLGTRTDSYTELPWPAARRTREKIQGEVVYTDAFGNLVTNIHHQQDLSSFSKDALSISIGRRKIRGLSATYAGAGKGRLLALINSWGYLEIAVRDGSARELCRASAGTRVVVSRLKSTMDF